MTITNHVRTAEHLSRLGGRVSVAGYLYDVARAEGLNRAKNIELLLRRRSEREASRIRVRMQGL